ncbi:MAG TPA: prolyl oligopeptidase family serine peptidase, partial [Bacteroidales bacterium]|nr:prolyl oligopeptidase family serine peptidase [Bacteroidales bacterium]
MILHILFASLLLLSTMAVYSGGQSEPKTVSDVRGFTINDLFRTRSVAEVAISPDRKFIAYTLNVPRPFNHQPGADYQELYLYNIATHRVQSFITGTENVVSIGWSPDSKRVVFRANFPETKGTQVYAIDISGGEAYSLTRHPQPVIQYGFAGNNLLVFTAAAPETAERRAFREKGFNVEIFEEELSHLNLYITVPGSGTSNQLTKDVTVFDFAVSPDGQRIAAAIAPKNLVDHSFMLRRIHIVDIATRNTTLLVENPGKLGRMSWSPDGRHLAFISSSHINDAVAGSLFVVNVQMPRPFDQLRNYLLDMRASAIDVTWRDTRTLVFATEEGVDIVLSTQRLADKQRKILMPPARTVFYRVSHSGGLIAFAGNTPSHPSELFLFDSRKRNLRKLTDHNPWLENINLGEQKKIVYDARDGLDIEGVLIYPVNYEEGKKYPMIVYIHGGPEAAVQNGWNTQYFTWGQIAAARGYLVFMPNYRAGSGRGVDFTMAGFGDLLGKEYDDVIDGIDYLIKKGVADPQRIGIGGGSYGGYFAA